MKFATKLNVLFTGILLVTTILLSYLVFTSNVKTVEKLIKDRLENQAFHSVTKIDMMIVEKRDDLNKMALDPILTDRGSSPEQIYKKLTYFKKLNEDFESLTFFDMNRVRIADTSGKDIGNQHPLINYWKEIFDGKQFVVDISRSVSLGRTIIHFAVVVKDKNRDALGVIVARSHAGELFNVVQQAVGVYDAKRDFKIDLVDKDGLVLYSNYNDKLILTEKSPDWPLISDTFKGSPVGSLRHRHHGGAEEIFSFAAEPGYAGFTGSGWRLIINVPSERAFASAKEIGRNILAIMAIICTISIFIIYIFSRTMTRPIKALNDAAARVKETGDLAVDIEVTSQDEIGQLTESFNEMVKDLKMSRERMVSYNIELEKGIAEGTRRLKEANEQLEATVAERTEELTVANYQLLRRAQELEELNRQGTVFGQMIELLQACNEVDEAYSIISKSFARLFPTDSGGLYLLSSSKNLLEAVAVWGDEPPQEEFFGPDECWSLRRGQTHCTMDSATGVYCKHISDKERAHICVPLIAQGEPLGVLSVSIKSQEYLSRKRQMIDNMAEQTGLAIANLKLRDTLRNMSIRDSLTNLYNRRYMDESVDCEMNRSTRSGKSLGLIMMDIDHFKIFNDTHGHDAGDALLREFCMLLRRNVRNSDIACRYGGEEFCIILPDTSLEAVLQRAEHLRTEAKGLSIQSGGHRCGPISVSFGVAVFPDHGSTKEELFLAADAALYRAKRNGRDQVLVAEKPLV